MSDILSYFVELIKLYLLLRLLGYSTTKNLIAPCCAAVASCIAIWFAHDNMSAGNTLMLTVFLTVPSGVLFVKGRNKTIAALSGLFILYLIDIFLKDIFALAFTDPIYQLENLTSLIIIAAVFIMLRLSKKPPVLSLESFRTSQVLLFVIGLICFALLIAPYQIADFENNSQKMTTFLSLLSTISGVFLITIAINAGQKRHFRDIANLTEKARKDQEKYFQLLLSKEEETKKFRHDINNHLYSIKYLLENEHIVELKKYLDDLDIISTKLSPEIQTGSDIINAIICELRHSYKDVQYVLDWNGCFPSDINLAPVDLSSIFYNLLSNAIEAVEKLPAEADKTISVKVKQTNNLLYIGIKNPCAGKAIKAGSGFTTSKKSSALHGYGSQNVALSVQKYGGEIKHSIAENEFEAEIFFADLP